MTDDWIIGFMWAQGTLAKDRFTIRYKKDPALLQGIAEHLGIPNRPFRPTEDRWALKMSASQPIVQRLLELGWTGRMDKERTYPTGEFNEAEFVRGYCYSKHYHSQPLRYKRDKTMYRIHQLLIYGSLGVVDGIEWFFHSQLHTGPKKIQLRKGSFGKYEGQTYAVVYQKKEEVFTLLEFINSGGFPSIIRDDL